MRYILQLNTGAFGRCEGTAQDFLRKLGSALDLLDVSDVILGWSDREGLNAALCSFLRLHHVRSHLWLPVLSEVRDASAAEPLIAYNGQSVSSIELCEGEHFDFVCPSSPANREAAIRAYEALAEGCEPDGVFIDRIRYPSVANAPSALYGCRCKRCLVGVPAHVSIVAPLSRHGGRYCFGDTPFDALMAAKRATITQAVCELTKAFHQKGLLVGLDVFAPALADYVGQDVETLARTVDFIKPMMYRRTFAPAGIPFEFDAIAECCGTQTADAIMHVWGGALTDDRVTLRQLTELQSICGNVASGVDANPIAPICTSDAAYVRQSIAQAKEAGCSRVVLSWNLMRMQDELLRAIAE